MKKIFTILFLLLVCSPVIASHLSGGEISYSCLGNGNFRFRVTVYRDCSGVAFNNNSVVLDGPVQINCPLIGSYDITPSCLDTSSPSCVTPATVIGKVGSIGKFVFETTVNLSSLGPAPIPGGYVWYTSNLPCCRNSANNIAGTGASDMTLKIVMHPFLDISTNQYLTPAQLCDNSPEFLEDPNNVEVVNPFDTVFFHAFGRDPDISDRLGYYIDNPLSGINNPIPYSQGYSAANPFPGLFSTSPIDSLTGIMRYSPTLAGNYTIVVKVTSTRLGQVISEIYRDFQFRNIVNPVNSTPVFNPANLPGSASYQEQQQSPKIIGNVLDPISGLPNRSIWVVAGDVLSIDFTVKDSFPSLPAYNTISTYLRADVLGANGIDSSSGCNQPPCAILQRRGAISPPVTFISHRSRQLGYGFVATNPGEDIDGTIYWTTAPQHATRSGQNLPVPYYFGVFAFDDNCKIIGRSAEFFEVVVFPNLVTLPPASSVCLDPQGGMGVMVRWDSSIDTLSIDPMDIRRTDLDSLQQLARSVNRRRSSFVAYKLYREVLGQTGMQLLATIHNPDSTSFLDVTANQTDLYVYKLETISNLDTMAIQTAPQRVRPVPQVSYDRNSMTYTLFWNAPYISGQMPPAFQEKYFIYQRNLNQGPSAWQLIDSVSVNTSYTGSFVFSSDTLEFEVRYEIPGSCGMEHSERTRFAFDQSLSLEESQKYKMKAYPNPAQDIMSIQFEKPLSSDAKLLVKDMEGRLVLSVLLDPSETGLYRVSLAQLSAGRYQLMVVGEQGVLGVGSLVKQP